MYAAYQKYTAKLHREGKYRRLPPPQQGEGGVDFASNDYLGLSRHPALLAAGLAAAEKDGTGATGSRLLSGNSPLAEELEHRIAADKKMEASLILNTGFQGNLTVLSVLLDPRVLGTQALVFSDRLNHSSLYQGLFLSQAQMVRFRHLDMAHLAQLLQDHAGDPRPKFIVAETVYGMDGDVLPLADVVSLARQHHACLYLDEAHGTGVWGDQGYGLSTTVDLTDVACVVMGTFSKALGVSGAYVACALPVKEYLINKAAGFIYTTAPSPFVLGAAHQAWKMLPDLNVQRQHLKALGNFLRVQLHERGWSTGTSTSHIVPLLMGTAEQALGAQQILAARGIRVSCVRPPTVPPGTSRLRIALNSSHTEKDVSCLLEGLSCLPPRA